MKNLSNLTSRLMVLSTLLLLLMGPASAVIQDTNGIPIVDSANIIIKSTNYDPAPAEPGNYVDIFIVVQNIGNVQLGKSYLKLEEKYPFSFDRKNDGIKEVDLIPPGREELLEYRMRIDDQAIEGTYELDVTLCADAKCETELRTSSIDIIVKTGGKPKLEIGLEDSSIFMPGTLGSITVSSVNRGKLGIKFLSIEIMESEDYEVTSPNRAYIGELTSDDFETEDFNFYVKPEFTGSALTVPIKVEYSDDNFKEYSGIEDIEIKVYSKELARKMGLVPQKSPTAYIISGIIILALLLFWYRKRKKA